jgi:hypothetical protein
MDGQCWQPSATPALRTRPVLLVKGLGEYLRSHLIDVPVTLIA